MAEFGTWLSKGHIVTSAQEDEGEVIHIPDAPSPRPRGSASDDVVHHSIDWLTAMQVRKGPGGTVGNDFSRSIVGLISSVVLDG